MLFDEHLRQIYETPTLFPGENGVLHSRNYDPLTIDRNLTIVSQGKMSGLLADWQCVDDDKGDVNESKDDKKLIAARAESQLVDITRKAFSIEPFDKKPHITDAVVLEILHHYLRWMEKKGKAE